MNNRGRALSLSTKSKISRALAGRKYPNRPKPQPRFRICTNPTCDKKFKLRFWRPATNPIKYCSRKCAMRDIGGRPTSPRAARAKAGTRRDVSPTIYFFSRWEANYARLLNYLSVQWIHQPKTFQLKSQKYTPDFYLPEVDTYVEIKNYLFDYSKNRDQQFRERYPKLKLALILKEDYLALQKEFAPKINKAAPILAPQGRGISRGGAGLLFWKKKRPPALHVCQSLYPTAKLRGIRLPIKEWEYNNSTTKN